MKNEGWNIIDEKAGVLWREYLFTKKARATTLVFRGQGGLVVVSPPRGLAARDYDAIKEHGEVRALVANNGFHHLGQEEWRTRFPDAVSYAPAGAIARLSKKAPGVSFLPLSELTLPSHAQLDVPPGYKTGEVIARVATSRGPVWFTGDLLTNMQSLPPPPVRWMFTATDSAPGFKLFRLGVFMLVKDKAQVREWMLARISEAPPALVVPGHGPVFETGDVARAARTQLERL